MEAWKEELYHYAKGETAKNHKYIRKEGNRYIYADDNKGSTKNKSGIGNWLSGAVNTAKNAFGSAVEGTIDIANSVGTAINDTLHPDDKQIREERAEVDRQVAAAQTKLKELIYEAMEYAATHDGVDDVYFDKDKPKDPALFDANFQNIKSGKWNKWSQGSVFMDAVRAYNEWQNALKRRDYLDGLLKHSDADSLYISHGCLGGTAIIHRF